MPHSRLLPASMLTIGISLCTGVPAPARAESTSATCGFSRHDPTIPVETRSCTPSASGEGLRFNREGDVSQRVLWRSDPTVIAKPPGWQSHNLLLGRWQGESTAGRAVIDVLTLEPNRIRWGNPFNGVCDSDYSVEILSPRQPADPVSGVVRLTLRPRPCATGDAVIQLAVPPDGSGLEVETYRADGRLIGQYGTFTPLRGEPA